MLNISSRRMRYGLAAILAAALFVVAGCGGGGNGAGAPEPQDGGSEPQVGEAPTVIKIGQSLSRSGALAAQAHGQDLAVQLWAETVNEGGGLYVPEYDKRIPVELITYDDESSPDKMLQNYERLLEVDNVHLLFPPVDTSMHVALAPFVEKHQVPVVGSSAASTMLRDLVLRTCGSSPASCPTA